MTLAEFQQELRQGIPAVRVSGKLYRNQMRSKKSGFTAFENARLQGVFLFSAHKKTIFSSILLNGGPYG